MLKALQQLGKTSVIYGLGSASSKILAFLLLPIYTRFLTPEDYGVLALLTTTATIIGLITQMGIGSALFWAILREEIDERTSISTALFFLLIEGVLVFGVLGLFTPQLSAMIFDTRQYSYLLQLTFTVTLLSSIDLVFMATLRIREKARTYAFFSLTSFIVSTFFKIFFVVVLDLGLDGIIYSNVIVALIFAVIYIVYLQPYISLRISYPILKRMLVFGAPLITIGISNLVMTSADRYVLQEFSTTTEVGLYSLGYNMGLAIMLAVQAVQLAWPAQFLTITKQDNAPIQLSQITTYYFGAMAFLALLISIFAREAIIVLTTGAYYSAYVVVPLIVVSYLLHGMRNMTNIGLWLENKNKYLIPITLVAALLNLLLNFWLIPDHGMLGAAWATIIAYSALLTMQLVINLRFYSIPYEYNRIIKITLVSMTLYIISLAFNVDNLWIAISAKALLIAIYPIILFLARFYTIKERLLIKTLIARLSFLLRKQLRQNKG